MLFRSKDRRVGHHFTILKITFHTGSVGRRSHIFLMPFSLSLIHIFHQRLYRPGQLRLPFQPSVPGGDDLGRRLLPVSYTHLDVYKRQVPQSAETGA